jgi:Holliday junction resolvase
MSRKSRNKGARFELEMLRHLQARGYSAMKSQQRKAGGGDFPDVLAVQASGNLPLHVECKNVQGLPSVQHMDALAQAQATLPKDGGVALAVHKLARKPIEDAIVTMRLGDFLALYERGGMLARKYDEELVRDLRNEMAVMPDGTPGVR